MNCFIIGHKGQLGTDCLSVFHGRAVGLDFPDINIVDRVQCLDKLDELSPSIIINCAAYTAVDACETDLACWRVNADGPKYLAEWAANHGAFLVHISTDYVFDGDKPLFESYLETDPPAPISEYGRSKLAGERAVMASGAKAAILRTAWLYGANRKNFLKTMLRLAVQNPDHEIRVVNDQFGSPTGSHTLARQIEAVIAAKVTGLFHATSEGYCSWFDLANRFLSLMKVPFSITPCAAVDYSTSARRPKNSILENAVLKYLGLNIFENWEVELDRFVHQHRVVLMDEIKGLPK